MPDFSKVGSPLDVLDMMTAPAVDVTAPNLKEQAEASLTKLLRHGNNMFVGDQREIVVLAMASFACEVLAREIQIIFGKKP